MSGSKLASSAAHEAEVLYGHTEASPSLPAPLHSEPVELPGDLQGQSHVNHIAVVKP